MRTPDSFTVQVGSAVRNFGGEFYKVSKVYSKIWSLQNDIGMLKVQQRISLDGITKKIIAIPSSTSYYPNEDTNTYIQGWG